MLVKDKISIGIGVSMILSIMLLILYASCLDAGISFWLCLICVAIFITCFLVPGLGIWFIIRAFL